MYEWTGDNWKPKPLGDWLQESDLNQQWMSHMSDDSSHELSKYTLETVPV